MADDAVELGERHQREMADMVDRQSQERGDIFERHAKELQTMLRRNPDLLKPGYGEGETIPSQKPPISTEADLEAETSPTRRTRDPGAIVDPTEYMTQKQAKRYKTQQDAAAWLREHRPGGVPDLSDPAFFSGKDI